VALAVAAAVPDMTFTVDAMGAAAFRAWAARATGRPTVSVAAPARARPPYTRCAAWPARCSRRTSANVSSTAGQ
jgi:hypothetical protein